VANMQTCGNYKKGWGYFAHVSAGFYVLIKPMQKFVEVVQ